MHTSDSRQYKTYWLLICLSGQWLPCELILLCHLINVAEIFIIPGRDHGASCKFPARANRHCGLFVCAQQ